MEEEEEVKERKKSTMKTDEDMEFMSKKYIQHSFIVCRSVIIIIRTISVDFKNCNLFSS